MTLPRFSIAFLLLSTSLAAAGNRATSLLHLLSLPTGQSEAQQAWQNAAFDIAEESRIGVISELLEGALERPDRSSFHTTIRLLALRYCLLAGPTACLELEDRARSESEVKGALVSAALEYRIRQLIRSLPQLRLQVDRAPLEGEIPEWVSMAPPRVRSAYLTYQAIWLPFDLHRESLPRPVYPVQSNTNVFYDRALDALQGRKAPFSESYLAFHWSSGCGTGSLPFLRMRNRLLISEWLREGELLLPLSALFQDWAWQSQAGALERDYVWQAELIRRLGFDEQQILLGALLEGARVFGLSRLHARPDPEGLARSLLQALNLPLDPARRRRILFNLSTLVSPGAAGERIPSRLQNQSFLDDSLQLEILRKMAEYSSEDSWEATQATHLLFRLKREESVSHFWQLLTHPNRQLQESSYATLLQMGYRPPELPPLQRILLNLALDGEPLDPSGVEVGWYRGQTRTHTTPEGFFVEHPLEGQPESWGLQVERPSINTPDQSWFQATYEIDPDSPPDELFLEIESAPLTLELPGVESLGETGFVELTLSKKLIYRDNEVNWRQISVKMQLPATPTLLFPRLQPGEYRLKLRAAGFAFHEEELELQPEGSRIRVELQKGTDLQFHVETPGSEKADRAPWVTLKDLEGKNHEGFGVRPHSYRNLPAGRYRIDIQSSQSKRQSIEKNLGGPMLEPAKYPSYHGHQEWIEIGPQSPPLIDLGTIRLQEVEESGLDRRTADRNDPDTDR